jgi:hypothetical protein
MKTCPDCGRRGTWPKTIALDTCEKCTGIRLRHDAIRRSFYDRCPARGACDPFCAACTEYRATDTYQFFTGRSR